MLLNFTALCCVKSKVHVNNSEKNINDLLEIDKCETVEETKNNLDNIPTNDLANNSNNTKNKALSNAAKTLVNLTKTKSDKTQVTIEKKPLKLSASQIKVYNEKDPTPDKLKLNKTQKSEKISKEKNTDDEEDTLNNVDTLDDDDTGVTKADNEKAKASISTDVITVFPELYKKI